MTTLHNGRPTPDPSALSPGFESGLDLTVDLTAERAAEALRAAACMTGSAEVFRPVLDLAICTGNWDAAAVSMVVGATTGHIVAATTETAEAIDRRQFEFGQGPCLAAITSGAPVTVDDVARDRRWPNWSRYAAELGVIAAMSAPLFTDCTLGALNLYRLGKGGPTALSRAQFTRVEITARELADAQLLAAHASVLLAHFSSVQNLRRAMDARNVIGQAQGVLMERYQLDPSTAFAVLRRYSNQSHRKVAVVAKQLIATGRLPDLAAGSAGLAGTMGGQLQNMTEQADLPDSAEETDDIPNPSTGVGLGADDEPDTFEPEEAPE